MSGAASQTEPVGSLQVALVHGARLLQRAPALALEQADAILEAAPGQRDALLLRATALRLCGEAEGAKAELKALVQAQPHWASAWRELGLTWLARGDAVSGAEALRKAIAITPGDADAWLALADALRALGDDAGADQAYSEQIRASVDDPHLVAAATALCADDLPVAERLLRDRLKIVPTEVAAIRMLAEVAGRIGRYADAERLLERCLELAPGFSAARHNYAIVLHRQDKSLEAIAELDRLLASDPRNAGLLNLKAAVLGRVGEFGRAIPIYQAILAEYADQPKIWMNYGHALKTAGRTQEGVDAYRRTIELDPECGEAWWSLANLKTYSFSDDELGAMTERAGRAGASDEDRLHLHYALGKALEDRGAFEAAFGNYQKGAQIRRGQVDYSADEMAHRVQRSCEMFSAEFFAEREGWGCEAPDPIFIVGLPRSGSTLIEQILSSHSQVEGTMELAEIIAISRDLSGRKRPADRSAYPETLIGLGREDVRALGERYIARTRVQRKTGRPFFIDKMPNNFLHLGLISLILPRARIVDARRDPLSACFSGFKQHFARGQHFSYSLEEIGLYYRDYVRLMNHFDSVLPGRVHRVIYDQMVDDTEGETRRLLAHCGLAFEPACMRFYETERAVRTASSEQVRRPIYREGLDQWRKFEAWLEPLKTALGPALDTWRE